MRLTVQMSPTWDAANPQTNNTNPNTVDAGNTYVPWPVVQSVTAAPLSLYSPQLPRWTYVLLRYFVAVDMSNAAALVAYMDATPCPVSQQLNDTAWICGVSPDMLLALKRAPPLFTLSWTGGPGGPGYGVFACPRPVITSALAFPLLDTAVSSTITIPGFCLSTATGPWQDVNATNAATVTFGPGGRLVGTVLSANTTSLVVQLPPSAGYSTVSITSNSSLLPQPLSGTVIAVSYRTPQLSSFITSRGGAVVSPAGETIFLVGRYFSLPSSGTTVKVSMPFISAAVPCTHRNDTHILCVMPSFNAAATLLGVTSGSATVTVEGSVSSALALGYQAATISYVTPSRTYTTIGTASKTFRIYGTGFGLRSTDVSSVTIGGSSCTTMTWLNGTTIQCDMNAAALGRMQNGSAVVVMTGMSVAPAVLAKAVTISGTPAINRVYNSPGLPASTIMIDGSALGYGTTATGVILGVGVTSTLSGDLACSSLAYPSILGSFIRCTPPASGSLSVNTRYQVYVKLEVSPRIGCRLRGNPPANPACVMIVRLSRSLRNTPGTAGLHHAAVAQQHHVCDDASHLSCDDHARKRHRAHWRDNQRHVHVMLRRQRQRNPSVSAQRRRQPQLHRHAHQFDDVRGESCRCGQHPDVCWLVLESAYRCRRGRQLQPVDAQLRERDADRCLAECVLERRWRACADIHAHRHKLR